MADIAATFAGIVVREGGTQLTDAAGRLVGRTPNERNVLTLLYGEVRALRAAAAALERHWTSLLKSDYVDPNCC